MPTETSILERHIRQALQIRLSYMPVVLVHGARQSGKTTFVKRWGQQHAYRYISFDDDTYLNEAQQDPKKFVSQLEGPVILDEVQRVPRLFRTLKMAIDDDRQPGRFILTGSTNILSLPHLTDSLAGRMSILHLHPLSQNERTQTKSHFLDRLFEDSFAAGSVNSGHGFPTQKIVQGGYPALLHYGEKQPQLWYQDYITSLINRDVTDIYKIHSSRQLHQLLQLLAAQTSTAINCTRMGDILKISRTTVKYYLSLLERFFLITRLPAFSAHPLAHLIRSPKWYMADTGVACALLGLSETSLTLNPDFMGKLFETFILQELIKLANHHDKDYKFYYYRDKKGFEVDVVIQREDGKCAALEIKSASTLKLRDSRGVQKLKSLMPKQYSGGGVIYTGQTCVGHAIPYTLLWQ